MNNTFATLASLTLTILGIVPKILIAFVVIAILYGVEKTIWHGDDEEERKQGRYFIVFGIIGLFTMVSIWGLVGILTNTFNFHLSNPFNPVQEINDKTPTK